VAPSVLIAPNTTKTSEHEYMTVMTVMMIRKVMFARSYSYKVTSVPRAVINSWVSDHDGTWIKMAAA